MKTTFRFAILLAWFGTNGLVFAAPLETWAEDAALPWNRHALALSYGYVQNPGTLSARDGWRRTVLGSTGEWDAEWTLAPGASADLALGASHVRGHATVRPQAAADIGARALSVRATQWGLHVRARRYLERRPFPFDPWLGGGVTAGMLTLREQERSATPGGPVLRPARNAAYPFAGLRAMAGIDIYPIRDSALLLRLQTRYDLNAVAGGFQGHTNGYAVQIGLQWNFWPVAP